MALRSRMSHICSADLSGRIMLTEIFKVAWAALGRNPVRSLLTMTGIAWGIVAVKLLLSYGSGFRGVLMYTLVVFGKGGVVCWAGTTSGTAGRGRARHEGVIQEDDGAGVDS